MNHVKLVKKMNMKLYSSNEMKKLLKDAGFDEIVFEYFKGIWIPIRGHMVPKGMIVKAIKR